MIRIEALSASFRILSFVSVEHLPYLPLFLVDLHKPGVAQQAKKHLPRRHFLGVPTVLALNKINSSWRNFFRAMIDCLLLAMVVNLHICCLYNHERCNVRAHEWPSDACSVFLFRILATQPFGFTHQAETN